MKQVPIPCLTGVHTGREWLLTMRYGFITIPPLSFESYKDQRMSASSPDGSQKRSLNSLGSNGLRTFLLQVTSNLAREEIEESGIQGHHSLIFAAIVS